MTRRLAILPIVVAAALSASTASAENVPTLVRDVKTGMWRGGTRNAAADAANFVQPDTQIEPSIAVNPKNPDNVVIDYQEGRIDSGGDATNGYATTFDGGKTWQFGELPGLTNFPGQTGPFDRASDAVVAFGPNNTVYANSLVFDQDTPDSRSGMAVNVSKDGGRTWSQPVFFQDDTIPMLMNDKNWIVVDNGTGVGHTYGRVYVVWDRIAPVVYNYCDHDCDQAANWLPNLQTIPFIAWGGQGLGAYPVITATGGLGVGMTMLAGALPVASVLTDQPSPEDIEGLRGPEAFMLAPAAGATPWPAPLAFTPPIQIATIRSRAQPAQRGPGGIPSMTVNPKSGAIHMVWDDGATRALANDVVISTSTNMGATWSKPAPVNPGPRTDAIDHYGASIDADAEGVLHLGYRVRNEAEPFSPFIDSYYQESKDDGKTWTAPLKINIQASDMRYGAFSRGGTFEGDYDQLATMAGSSYFVRCQGAPAIPGEPIALKPQGTSMTYATSRSSHQHQSCWVSLIKSLPPGAVVDIPGPTPPPGSKAPAPRKPLHLRLITRRVLSGGRIRLRLTGATGKVIKNVTFYSGRHRIGRDTKAPFEQIVRLPNRHRARLVVRAIVRLKDGRKVTLVRTLRRR